LALVLFLAGGSAYYRHAGAGAEMAAAAKRFLATLSDEQRAKTVLDFDSPKRVAWHFIPLAERKGLQIKEMNASQRAAAHDLLRAALSQAGYEKARTIMSLEAILRELEKRRSGGPIRDPERYYFTLFGAPGEKGRWGLSVEGHHLSLNFVVEDGTVVATTPAMFGANPAIVMADYGVGAAKGTRVLEAEEELAFELVRSLDADQQKTAILSAKAPADVRSAGSPQPPTEPAAGLDVGKMNPDQQRLVKKLLDAYISAMPEEAAAARRKAIDAAGPERIRFAWAGATKPGVGHYYRLEGPTFQVEFCNTQPDSAGNPANHIHCMWRDTGGDFGIPAQKK
jgi:hypothetical protein